MIQCTRQVYPGFMEPRNNKKFNNNNNEIRLKNKVQHEYPYKHTNSSPTLSLLSFIPRLVSFTNYYKICYLRKKKNINRINRTFYLISTTISSLLVITYLNLVQFYLVSGNYILIIYLLFVSCNSYYTLHGFCVARYYCLYHK